MSIIDFAFENLDYSIDGNGDCNFWLSKTSWMGGLMLTAWSGQISVISFGQLPTVAGHDKILLTGGGSCHGWLKADHCRLQLATEWLISSSWRFLGRW